MCAAGKLTDYIILQLLFASVGAEIPGCVSSVSFRSEWLGHYARKLTGCATEEEDKGYETEDPQEAIRTQLEFEHDEKDDKDGEGSDSGVSEW